MAEILRTSLKCDKDVIESSWINFGVLNLSSRSTSAVSGNHRESDVKAVKQVKPTQGLLVLVPLVRQCHVKVTCELFGAK